MLAAGAVCTACGKAEFVTPSRQVTVVSVGAVVVGDPCCLGCGRIMEGPHSPSQICREDRIRLLGLQRLNSNGDAKALGLPQWVDPVLQLNEASLRPKRLIQQWSAMARKQRQWEICQRIGLKNGHAVQIAAPSSSIPDFTIDNRVVSHILDGNSQNHIMYAPLLPATIADPFEVWERDHDGHEGQLLFLRKFLEGQNEITYLVVGDKAGQFLRTGYRLKGPFQAEALRRGTLVLASWAHS